MKRPTMNPFVLSVAVLFLGPAQAQLSAAAEPTFIVREGDRAYDEGRTLRLEPAAVISELGLDNGSILRFVDESIDGGVPRIGVVEVTAPRADSVLRRLTRTQELTPLELYLALAPRGAAVPSRLAEHHQEIARTRPGIPREPRVVNIAPMSRSTEVGGCYGEWGDSYHLGFILSAGQAFGGALPNHGHGHDLASTHYGVTGFSSRRALGTCNYQGYVKSVGIEYQWSPNLWVAVPLGVSWLFPGQSLFYYSDSGFLVPQQYRIKVGFTAQGLPWNTAHTEGSW